MGNGNRSPKSEFCCKGWEEEVDDEIDKCFGDQELEYACDRVLDCGHLCSGMKGEAEHNCKCLKESCNGKIDDCFVCLIRQDKRPSLKLTSCDHVHHYDCLMRSVNAKVKDLLDKEYTLQTLIKQKMKDDGFCSTTALSLKEAKKKLYDDHVAAGD